MLQEKNFYTFTHGVQGNTFCSFRVLSGPPSYCRGDRGVSADRQEQALVISGPPSYCGGDRGVSADRQEQALNTPTNKNPSVWNFLSPELEVTWRTVAIIIRVVLLAPSNFRGARLARYLLLVRDESTRPFRPYCRLAQSRQLNAC